MELAPRAEPFPAFGVMALAPCVHRGEDLPGVGCGLFFVWHFCVLVHVRVDSPALRLTAPDRRPPRGQPLLNIHGARTLFSFTIEVIAKLSSKCAST